MSQNQFRQTSSMLLDEVSRSRRSERRIKLKKEIELNKKVIEERCRNTVNSSQFNDNCALFEVHPLSIISEEGVWMKILGYLEDPLDISSASRTCSLFKNLLERERTLVLFRKVLPILGEKEYLSLADTLKIRFLSKSYKRLVDDVIFEERYTKEDWYPRWGDRDIYQPTVKNVEMVNKIISSFNPKRSYSGAVSNQAFIFTRALTILEDSNLDESELNEFHIKVLKLLEMCGHSVWGVVYRVPIASRPFWRVYDTIRRWTLMLPNLKALKFENLAYHIDGDDRANEEVVLLENFIRDHPFPTIPSLQHYQENVLPSPITTGILRTNSSIKSVFVTTLEIDRELCEIIQRLDLERLSALKFSSLTPSFLPQCQWNLKRLFMADVNVDRYWTSSNLFRFLNRFRNTLLVLEMFLDLVDDGSYLELPNLTTLNCSFRQNFNTLDFLSPCKSLESLSIELNGLEMIYREDPSEAINFKGYVMRFYESNIWKIFPSLKKVVLGGGWRSWRKEYVRNSRRYRQLQFVI